MLANVHTKSIFFWTGNAVGLTIAILFKSLCLGGKFGWNHIDLQPSLINQSANHVNEWFFM